jgi:hypothetical protein
MNQGKYVFAQLIEFLSHNDFNRCVAQHQGNYKVQHFTCWHQLLCMMFGQLSNRESLSDLIICLQSQQSKYYHLGMGNGPSKNNLAKANENRDYRIYESFAATLIKQVQLLCIADNTFELSINAPVYALDATVIDLCLDVFWWAKFRQHKGAIKLHTLFDIKSDVPTFIHITDGSVHEVNILDTLPLEKSSFYIMDKAYIDFKRLHRIHDSGAYFVTRAKDNFTFVRLYSRPIDKNTGLKCDQTIRLKNNRVLLFYPDKIRRIKYYDEESNNEFVFITNNFDLTTLEIARLYKYRWRIELFFKWIKQHLKIKAFWGYSMNAVKTQVYIAIITYLLVAIVKHKMKLKQSQYEILQILSISLLCKVQLNQLFSNPNLQYVKELIPNQLNIFDL